MNNCSFIGNINKPELRYLPDSTPVLQFSLAANSGYGDKKQTTWINCQLFGKRATTLEPMLKTGDRVGVTGELTNRKYTAKDGAEKYSLELRVSDVTLLGTKGATNETVHETRTTQNSEQSDGVKEAFDNFDSDIPF